MITTTIAILLGPIFAVMITLWYQNKKEKQQHKFLLFRTLMSRRADFPISQEWVDALNLIDVVFHDNKKAVGLWHAYHEMLYHKERDYEEENRKYLDLLHSLALDLGYKNLQQTDIDRSYLPVGLGDQKALSEALQREQLIYLQNSNKLYSAQIPEQTE
jgi:hypothetical protein